MAYIAPKQESEIKKNLESYIKKKYKNCKVWKNKVISSLFAPDFYSIQGKKKKRIFIFRNPPNVPKEQIDDIKSALSKGIGVYIYIFYNKKDRIMKNFQSDCEGLGIGILNYSGVKDFELIYPSIIDFPPKDNIIQGRIKVFISSKLWMDERDIVREEIKKLKHQQIQVERMVLNGPLEEECIKWVDESEFLLGVVTLDYGELIEKEVTRSLSKKPKQTLVYINNDCEKFMKTDCEKFKNDEDKKLCKLIKKVQKRKVSRSYVNNVDLKRKIRKELHDFISQNSIEALQKAVSSKSKT